MPALPVVRLPRSAIFELDLSFNDIGTRRVEGTREPKEEKEGREKKKEAAGGDGPQRKSVSAQCVRALFLRCTTSRIVLQNLPLDRKEIA